MNDQGKDAEKLELIRQAQAGDMVARAKIALEEKGLVISVSLRHLKLADYDMEGDDLIQYGWVGLMNAIKTFDPKRGKWSSHAAAMISQEVLEALQDCGTMVRIPRWVYWLKHRIRKHYPDFDAVSPEQAAIASGKKTAACKIALAPMPCRKGDGFIGTACDHRDRDIQQVDARIELASLMDSAGLTARERDVVTRAYGIGCPPEHVTDIGKKAGVSQQAIDHKKKSAIKKMRAYATAS